MNAAARQTALTLALPGLLVGAVYVFGLARGISADVRDAENELAQAQRGQPGAGSVETESARLAALETESATLRAVAGAASAPPPSDAGRAATSAEVTRILVRHGLRLVDETASGTAPIPPALVRASGDSASAAGRVRTLRFQGRFLAILAALDELPRAGGSVVPLRLTMTSDPERVTEPTWSLVLWI